MTTRSHWVSIAVFFACGVLTGIAGMTVMANQHQIQLVGGMRELRAALITGIDTPSFLQASLSGHLEADLTWLELSAAGRSDEAIATTAQHAKETLLRLSYEKGMHSQRHDMRATRLADWQAGTPWVHQELPDGAVLITPALMNADQLEAVFGQR